MNYKKINTFALRAFRETADKDYIHARMAYNAGLIPQFLWSSLHCLEKYSKCILLLCRIPNKNSGHTALESIERFGGKFDVEFSEITLNFIRGLETNGASDRYYEQSWFIYKPLIIELDKAVWEIRRFCNAELYNYSENEINFKSDPDLDLFDFELRSVKNTIIKGGWLEKVLDEKMHSARKYLVYGNFFYTKVNRKKVSIPSKVSAGNSPLYLYPEIIDELGNYIVINKKIKNSYKELLHKKSKPKTQ
ncbi:hypothetical protein [Marinicellulosiphila megalodicopiae]|uniref:hypothetical protein n=1 Tax=Marinicellulosiphila megalodicopiae TaxID=2724896 RepID=UPI003BB12E10